MPIAGDVANHYLKRFGLDGVPTEPVVGLFGAFSDPLQIVGVAALTRRSRHAGHVQVAVAPSRRMLGIGGDLLGAVLAKASACGLTSLSSHHASDALEPVRMANSTGLPVARRVRGNAAFSMILLPHSTQSA